MPDNLTGEHLEQGQEIACAHWIGSGQPLGLNEFCPVFDFFKRATTVSGGG